MNIYQSKTYRKDLSWLHFVDEPKGSRQTASERPAVLHIQRWSEDKCRCECKELIDKGRCDTEFIWNLSSFVCVNVINHVMLVSIYTMKTVNVEKTSLIN